MDKNTMIFLIIILLIAFVVGYLFWKSYEDKTKTTEYDPSVAWASSAASMTQSVGNVFSNIFGGRR